MKKHQKIVLGDMGWVAEFFGIILHVQSSVLECIQNISKKKKNERYIENLPDNKKIQEAKLCSTVFCLLFSEKVAGNFCTKLIYLFCHIYSLNTYVSRLLCPKQKKLSSCVSFVSLCVCLWRQAHV